MKSLALGYACSLNDIFVRFPYEKCKSIKEKVKSKKLSLIKKVFKESVRLIVLDIIENNSSFKLPSLGYYGGEIHMEGIKDEDFKRARKNGKFKDVDFLESLFTGYLMYLYVHGKRDDFLHRRKFPIYLEKSFKDKITEYTNLGKQYC